jgi:HlyD family secretion protein
MSGMDRKIEKRRWSPKRLAAIAAIAAVAFLAVWNVVSATRGTTLQIPGERLRISTVTRGEFQEFIPVVGTLIPITTHYLDAVEGGRVVAIHREAGCFVEKGDEILELSNTDLLLDVMYREAELFQQSNSLRNTKLTMEQNRLQIRRELLDIDHEIKRQRRAQESLAGLAESGLVSKREYGDCCEELEYQVKRRDLLVATQEQDSLFRAIQVRHLEESLDRMQANLSVIRENIGNLVVRAPVSGQLTSLNADIGESKARGERLGQVDVLAGFRVRAAIDEHYIARIHPGLGASFVFSGKACRLTISKVYPEVAGGRFEVDLLFEGDEPADVRRGQTFHVRLELGDPSEALLLPNGAFYQKTGGRWIYVLDSSGQKAHRQDITLGRQNSDFFELLDGLEPGDRAITSSYETYGDADVLVLQ